MKNFFNKTKKGFTLVELMIVIAVIGILIIAVSQFSMSANIAQEKVTRLAENIYDIMRDAKNNMVIGKTTDLKPINKRKVIITGTGVSVFVEKATDTGTVTEKEIEFNPQFDGDSRYRIEKIQVSDKPPKNDNKYEIANPNELTLVNSLEITITPDMDGSAIAKNSSTVENNVRTFLITVNYDGFRRYIYGDVLTGNAFLHTKIETPPKS